MNLKNLTLIFWNPTESRLRAFWRILLQLVVLFVLMVATIPLFLHFVVSRLDPSIQRELGMSAAALIQNGIMVLTALACCIFIGRRKVADLGLKITPRWWIDLAGGFALGAGLISGIFLIEYLCGWIEVVPSTASLTSKLPFCFMWIVAMAAVGTGEEIFSRGFHLKNLSEGFGRLGMVGSVVLASLISSMFFGFLHISNPEASIYSFLLITLAGLFFCVGRIATGSLAAPIGLHFSWNYFQGGVFGFPVSGNAMKGSLININQGGDPTWTGGEFGPEAGLLGLFAMLLGMVIFVFWPNPESNWKRTIYELYRYRKLKPTRKQSTIAEPTIPETDEIDS